MGLIQFKGGSIQFKGGTIQFKNLGKVANPTVLASWGGSSGAWTYRVQVTNNDTETVSVYASPLPSAAIYQGELAGGDFYTYTIFGPLANQPADGATFTAYVQLKQAGRLGSDIVSDESNEFVPTMG